MNGPLNVKVFSLTLPSLEPPQSHQSNLKAFKVKWPTIREYLIHFE